MAASDPVGRPHRAAAVALLIISCGLVALQAWNILRWAQAFDRGSTQAERVAFYLRGLPVGMGALGTWAITWLSVFCAAISLVTAVVAGRLLARTARAATKALVGVLVGINALLVLWYLFTLM